MSAAGRVFSSLTRFALNRGVFIDNTTTLRRLNNVRYVTLAPQRWSRPDPEDGEVNSEPIRFSTSKASHRTWRVERGMGRQFQRPWWKVLPISLFGIGFLLWCVLRGETDIDTQLEKQLYEHLPGLLSDDDDEEEGEEQVQSKSS